MVMSEVGMLADLAALTTWWDGLGIGRSGPLTVERMTFGHSNEHLLLQDGLRRYVLRRPPLTPHSPTAHDVSREYRVLRAIRDQDPALPIPEPVALCDDSDVIGAPFMVTRFIEGTVIRNSIPESLQAPGVGRDIGYALMDTLARIHSLDWCQDLTDFGRPSGFLDRQVPRWMGQLERYQSRPLPEVDELAEWLTSNQPRGATPALVHGDYTLVNVMFACSPPARPVAVMDWELSTIGDPLVDLGWILGLWHEEGEAYREGVDWGVVGMPGASDVPTRVELASRYERESGRDLTSLSYYCALGLFKLACVMEGSYARFASGRTDDPYFAGLKEGVPGLARRGLAFAEGTLAVAE